MAVCIKAVILVQRFPTKPYLTNSISSKPTKKQMKCSKRVIERVVPH
jgi:hypothetical protein